MTVGSEVKRIREDRGLSISALSKLSGVAKSYLWQIEGGEQRNPSLNTLSRLSAALEVSISELIGEAK